SAQTCCGRRLQILCRLANFSISFFMPWREKRTVSLASSPSPSRMRMVPSPYFEWRTRSFFLRLAAPEGAGMFMEGRGNAPGLPPPAFPPKKRAMLSMERGSAVCAGASPASTSAFDPALGGVGLALGVIQEATNGFAGEPFDPAPERLPPDAAAAVEDSW